MYDNTQLAPVWRWFTESRFGVYIQWGPASLYGRGESVLLQEHMDQRAYTKAACRWRPQKYNPEFWAGAAREAGFRFSVLTARSADGYCLWKTDTTDYSAVAQAARRDLFGDYVKAFCDAGLRVGVSYSLADWRLPVYWSGPASDPAAWDGYRAYIHQQLRELLTNYGPLDLLVLNNPGPYTQEEWGFDVIMEMARELQPAMIVSNGGASGAYNGDVSVEWPGDVSSSDHGGLWMAVRNPTWRHMGHAMGDRWLPTEDILDELAMASCGGGNLLLTIGPKANGTLPIPFMLRLASVGKWLKVQGEALYGTAAVAGEPLSLGHVTRRGRNLYLILRSWSRKQRLILSGLTTEVRRVVMVANNQELDFNYENDTLEVVELPRALRSTLFPVLRVECAAAPELVDWSLATVQSDNRERLAAWAATHGPSFNASQ
ncbi:MAG: alpha-L-fucosidase [Lentisphaerae bacterium]|jgi:alpha-L-fucosidase|nr:alpha-L-fucosidase [Lentisphaerota bacterium]